MTDRETMIAALNLVKAICEKISCADCPMEERGLCGSLSAPMYWEVPKE
jgi:hypothetical protein